MVLSPHARARVTYSVEAEYIVKASIVKVSKRSDLDLCVALTTRTCSMLRIAKLDISNSKAAFCLLIRYQFVFLISRGKFRKLTSAINYLEEWKRKITASGIA